MEKRLALVIFAVRDLQRAVSFYNKAFGWPQIVDTNVYAEFELSDKQRFGLYQREGFGINTGQTPTAPLDGEISGVELYFYTSSLQEAISLIEQAGARKLSSLKLRSWGDEAAYFADPDGNVIVLAREHDQDREA